MKHFTKLLTLTLAVTSSISVFAQIDDVINKPLTESQLKADSKRPASASLGRAFGFLFSRINKLEIQGMAQEMEKDGVKERKFIAAFNASGAAVYNRELVNVDYNTSPASEGLQLVPYTVKFNTDGSLYVAVNPVSFKEMVSLQNGENAWVNAGIFTVLDSVDFFVFKWDRGMSFEGINSFQVDLIDVNGKLDILNSPKKDRYLAITAGGSIGGSQSTILLDNGISVNIGGKTIQSLTKNKGYAETYNYRYGLEYRDVLNNGSAIRVNVSASTTNTQGYHMNEMQYNDDVAARDASKQEWDQFRTSTSQFVTRRNTWVNQNANTTGFCPYDPTYTLSFCSGWGETFLENVYTSQTTDKRPLAPTAAEITKANLKQAKIQRQQFYISPSIEFTKPLKNKKSITFGVGANIAVKDSLNGGNINADLSNRNRNTYNAKVIINF